MRDETCPTRLNRPFSREKPKPQMEYMSTSNCSLHKNDLISVTLATFSLLFVARSHFEWWRLEILSSEQFEVGICSISGHFWLWFLTIVLDTREGRIWFWSSAAWPLTFLFLSFSFFIIRLSFGQSQSKKGGRLVFAGKRQNGRRIRFPVPPFPALLLIFWVLRGKIEPCLKANDRPGEKAEMYKKCQHYLTKVFTTLNFFLN